MNRLLLLLFGAVSLVVHAQVPDYVPTEGLVAWYPFNGNANDESGNGYDGVVQGASLSENRFGIENQSFSFDGMDDYISVSNDFNFNELTVSVWIKQNQFAETYSAIIDRSLTNNIGWWIEDNAVSYDSLLFTGGVASGNYFRTQAARPQPNAWTHIGALYSSGNQQLFINGVLVDQDVNSLMLQFPEVTMFLGKRTNSAFWDGSIDDVGIWSRALTNEEIIALYNTELSIPGCTDTTACNFDAEATSDDGSCVYPPSESVDCEFGGNYCGEGTIWDASLQACVAFDDCPADLNGNGLVEVSDLLMVLADFGTECAPPVSEFTCGDPVSYHGYDYATVQIGEQCWLAENLRTELYSNGDTIPGNLSNEEWASTTEGAQAISIYGDALEMFGRAYNGYAVGDERGLCLSGWHVALDSEWKELEMELGMSEADANSGGWRGTDQGIQMKTTTGWSEGENGTNSSGFSAKPAGNRTSQGHWTNTVHNAFFWTPASSTGSASLFRHLRFEEAGVFRGNYGSGEGLSIRCLKD